MDLIKYLVPPLICAGIGWLTNYIAIKMLFHPRRPIHCGLFILHGIFPKRQGALAKNFGEMIEANLISHEDVQRIMHDPEFAAIFKGEAKRHVERFVSETLPTIHPMAGMFLTGGIRGKIVDLLESELDGMLPDLIRKASAELESRLDFKDMVREKVEAFSMERLEGMLFAIMKKEFRFIEIVGGVLGFVIGLAQSAILYATAQGVL